MLLGWPVLFVALSCLQGRPMDAAFAELCALGPEGIQLAPGNHVTAGFAELVAASGVATRTHHGFAWERHRDRVWDPETGRCLVASHSVHPPEDHTPEAAHWHRVAESGSLPILETMYPGFALGRGDQVSWAMDRGLPLAVDISHVFIQMRQGVMAEATWRRLQDYPALAEVHVSANRGRRDEHRPVDPSTFGLDWARARMRAGTPVVLECYMHKLPADARKRQLAIIRGP